MFSRQFKGNNLSWSEANFIISQIKLTRCTACVECVCVCVAPPSPALNGSSPPPSPPGDNGTPPGEPRAESRADSRAESRAESRAAAPEPPANTEAPTPPAKREDKALTAAVTNNNVEKEVTDKKVEELYDIPVGEYSVLVLLDVRGRTDWLNYVDVRPLLLRTLHGLWCPSTFDIGDESSSSSKLICCLQLDLYFILRMSYGVLVLL